MQSVIIIIDFDRGENYLNFKLFVNKHRFSVCIDFTVQCLQVSTPQRRYQTI